MKKSYFLAAFLGAAIALTTAASIAHRFLPQILSFEMPALTNAVLHPSDTSGFYDNPPLYAGLSMLMAPTMAAPQSNGGPLSGTWHAGAKEFTVNLNQAAGTYTLATAANMAGNGLGVHIVKMAFWTSTAATGGTNFSVPHELRRHGVSGHGSRDHLHDHGNGNGWRGCRIGPLRRTERLRALLGNFNGLLGGGQ